MKVGLVIYNTEADKQTMDCPFDCPCDPLFVQLSQGFTGKDYLLTVIVDLQSLKIIQSCLIEPSDQTHCYTPRGSLDPEHPFIYTPEVPIVNIEQTILILQENNVSGIIDMTPSSRSVRESTPVYKSYIERILDLVPQIDTPDNLRSILRTLPKTKREIAAIKEACHQVTKTLHTIQPSFKDCLTTGEVRTRIEEQLLQDGATEYAYPAIITQDSEIHPDVENVPLNPNRLLLIDLGTRFYGCCSDITRTYPLQGKFTPLQKQIYQIVLEAYKIGEGAVQPNAQFLDISQQVSRNLQMNLTKLGLFTDNRNARELTRSLMPHGLGHCVGVNVHDPARKPWVLRVNDVITVEPGLYFPDTYLDDERFNTQLYRRIYREVGCIRLENTVLVTDLGSQSLSDLPLEISEVEANST